LLHEIAHVAKHLTASDQIIIDDLDLRGHDTPLDDRIEKEADDMTLAGLIPKKVWQKNPIRGEVTTQKVYDLAEELKIHPAIIAGRVRYERNNYKLLSRHVGSKQVRKHFAESCSETKTYQISY
jgi:HTH-type transcriptional regulator/antitoxin HigA